MQQFFSEYFGKRTVVRGGQPEFSIIAARSKDRGTPLGKVQYFDQFGNGVHSVKAMHETEWVFSRIGMSSLGDLSTWLRNLDGQHILINGQSTSAEASWVGKRRMKDKETGETLFQDGPSRLLIIDVDRTSYQIDMLNPATWEAAGRALLEEIIPGAANTSFIIAPTASCYPGHIRFRIFVLTDQPLTAAQRRAVVGPLLETTKNPSMKDFGCDPAVYVTPQEIYLSGHFHTLTGEKDTLLGWIDQLSELNGSSYHGAWIAYAHLARATTPPADLIVPGDPYAACRVMMFKGEKSLRITDDLLDIKRFEHLTKKDRFIKAVSGAIPLSNAQRRALPYTELTQIPWETGTHDAIKEWLSLQSRRAAMNGKAFDTSEIAAMLDARMIELIADATQNANRPRVQALKGYRSRENPRLVEWAASLTFNDSTGDGYDDISSEEQDDPVIPFENVESLPLDPPVTMSLNDGESLLDTDLRRFTGNMLTYTPNDPLLIRGTVGLGKSRAIRESVMRVLIEPGMLIAIIVPTHRLAEEYLTAFNSSFPGLAAVYRGKDFVDPNGQELCAIPESDRRVWNGARGSSLTACAACAFRDRHPSNEGPCPYFHQDENFASSRIHIFAGGSVLQSSIPELVKRKTAWVPRPGESEDDLAERAIVAGTQSPPQYDLVIHDETSIPNWLGSEAIRTSRLIAEVEPSKHFSPDTERNMPLENALETFNRLGPQLCGAFVSNGLYRGLRSVAPYVLERDLLALRDAANRLKVHGDKAEAIEVFGRTQNRQEALKALKQKHQLAIQVYGMVDLIDTLRAGGSILVQNHGDEAESVHWQRMIPIHPHWQGSQIIILDATADPGLLRHWLPELGVLDIVIDEPPVSNRLFVEGALRYGDFRQKGDVELESRGDTLQRCRGIVAAIGAHDEMELPPLVGVIGPIGLVATDKDRDERLVQPSVVGDVYLSATFGSTRGLNHLKDVDQLVVLSRPLPPRHEVERVAGDIKGHTVMDARPGSPLDKGLRPIWVRTLEGLELGSALAWTHSDEVARAVLDSMVYAELVQADGRARAIRRGHNRRSIDQSDSVTIWHMTETPVPGLIYKTPQLPGMGPHQYLNLELADLDANTPRGQVMVAYRRGQGGGTQELWAERVGSESAATFKKMIDRNHTLKLVKEAADAHHSERINRDFIIQAECQAEVVKIESMLSIYNALVAQGQKFATLSERREASANAKYLCEINGLEWAQRTWERLISR